MTTSSQDTPECDLSARLASKKVVKVSVTIDTAPQAYFRLERTATEEEQNFSTLKHPVPTNLYHLGLDAYWLPLSQQVMTTDGVRLITVTIDWPGASTARNIRLGEAAARVFLGHSQPKAANGYPSG